jgi:alkylhydroperoxidase family enzyme
MTLARIRPLEPHEVDDGTKEIFDAFMKQRGNIPNMFRTLAYRPEYLKTAIAHFRTILGVGTVDLRIKEMLVVRVSQINDCDY